MFQNVRWRLTFWFVTITTAVYAVSTVSAILLFRAGLTSVIKEEMRALASEILPAIDLQSGQPSLEEWALTAHRTPFKALPTIQLFDANGKLIEQHGPHGVPKLYNHGAEVRAAGQSSVMFRVFSTPLTDKQQVVGYLQIQLSLKNRDRATIQFAETMASVAPLLFIGLVVSGYFFSSKAAEPLEHSLGVLRRFMNDAGHELSTPISIIQVNAEAMEPDIESNETAHNNLRIIIRASERMGKLVQDLMLLSKMESPQVEAKKVALDLDKLVRSVSEEFDALFRAKEIDLVYSKISPAQVFGDPDSLKRLVTNLLQNALRYTEKGGRVEVSLEPAGRQIRLRVVDSGIGIPAESLPRIFDRFYRVEKSRTRTSGGVGLGLSIVRAIVDSHRGRVEVQSEVGVGTTFAIIFPTRPGVLPAPSSQPRREES